MEIKPGGLDDARVVALLAHHHATCHAVTPKGSAHAFDVARLKAADVWFWAGWEEGAPVVTGALKRLSPMHGEIKAMHTAEQARRKGHGAVMLRHIITEALALGFTRLSLETGSFDFFAPARALYRVHGFKECEAFEGYRPDPNSSFMTRTLSAPF